MNYILISELIKEKYLSKLENYEIKTLNDVRNFHNELINVRTNVKFDAEIGIDVTPHYRGEQNFGWDILSGIFRPPLSPDFTAKKARKIEKKGVELFQKKVIEKYGEELLFKHNFKPFGKTWDLLFQAQHAGVKTTLIDFSTSSVASSFFMCESSDEHDNSDGQLWGMLIPNEFIFNETSDYDNLIYPKSNPYQLNSSFICNVPTYLNDLEKKTYQFRLYIQHGRLFASQDSDLEIPLNKKEFWKNMMIRVKVKSEYKKTIFEELLKAGIDRNSMMKIETEEADEMINEINLEIKNGS